MTPAAAADEGKRPEKAKRERKARERSNPLGRLRIGEAIYLVAAILLFVLMFLTWWEIGIGHETGGGLDAISLFDHGQSAWEALEVIPLFLMLAIVVAVGSALLRLGGSGWKPAVPPGAAVAVLGALAALLILIRIISPPSLAPNELVGVEYPVSVQLPAFLALAAALGIAYGGWRAMADEGVSFASVGKGLESPRPAKKKPDASAKRTTTSKATTTPKSPTASKSARKNPTSPRRPARKKPQA